MSTTTFSPQRPVLEASTREYGTQLVDLTDAPISGADVTSVLCTLLDARTNAVINGRDRQEVLNANGGAVSVGGRLTFLLTPDDTVAIGGNALQRRRLIFEIFAGGGRETHEVVFYVGNLPHLGEGSPWP